MKPRLFLLTASLWLLFSVSCSHPRVPLLKEDCFTELSRRLAALDADAPEALAEEMVKLRHAVPTEADSLSGVCVTEPFTVAHFSVDSTGLRFTLKARIRFLETGLAETVSCRSAYPPFRLGAVGYAAEGTPVLAELLEPSPDEDGSFVLELPLTLRRASDDGFESWRTLSKGRLARLRILKQKQFESLIPTPQGIGPVRLGGSPEDIPAAWDGLYDSVRKLSREAQEEDGLSFTETSLELLREGEVVARIPYDGSRIYRIDLCTDAAFLPVAGDVPVTLATPAAFLLELGALGRFTLTDYVPEAVIDYRGVAFTGLQLTAESARRYSGDLEVKDLLSGSRAAALTIR